MPPSVTVPVLSTRDRGQSELTDTTLNGEKISCFSVGGEFRLCLPQILNTVLDSEPLQRIHQACDELQIYCSTCSPDQLDTLKRLKILPISAYQCGLITKSDAERLCATLLERNPPRASLTGFNAKASPFSFKVEHSCFGKCIGILLPEACTSANARCIECLECEGLFSPPKFVCHSHLNAENRTCHWGFDSANWRSYLHLYEGYVEPERERLQRRFSDFKSKFANLATTNPNCTIMNVPKRKMVRNMLHLFINAFHVICIQVFFINPSVASVRLLSNLLFCLARVLNCTWKGGCSLFPPSTCSIDHNLLTQSQPAMKEKANYCGLKLVK